MCVASLSVDHGRSSEGHLHNAKNINLQLLSENDLAHLFSFINMSQNVFASTQCGSWKVTRRSPA